MILLKMSKTNDLINIKTKKKKNGRLIQLIRAHTTHLYEFFVVVILTIGVWGTDDASKKKKKCEKSVKNDIEFEKSGRTLYDVKVVTI